MFKFSKIPFYLSRKGLLNWLPDKAYLELVYSGMMGRKLDLNNPKAFTEKIQWLKLYDRNPQYIKMVDKYEVKQYVESKIGGSYVIKTYGVWDTFDEINFECLPNQFVLKCTHDSGGIVVCRDKSKLNLIEARKQIEKCLKTNYFWVGREWPYKNVKPRIIAEQYLKDKKTNELRDYKFFVLNGVVRMMFIAANRLNPNEPMSFDFYDSEFNHLDLKNAHPNAKTSIEKPVNFDLMKQLAEKLGEGIPCVRVDFYEVNGSVYFGEITFSHNSGLVPFEPDIWDFKIGDYLKLPKKKNNSL